MKFYTGEIQAIAIYSDTMPTKPTRWQRFLAWLGLKKRPLTVMDIAKAVSLQDLAGDHALTPNIEWIKTNMTPL